MEILHRVKNQDFFKDGNVIGGRQLKPGEVLVVTALEKQQIEQSGGHLDVIEQVIRNPLKAAPVEPPVSEPEVLVEVEPEVKKPEVVKRKAGRPKRNNA